MDCKYELTAKNQNELMQITTVTSVLIKQHKFSTICFMEHFDFLKFASTVVPYVKVKDYTGPTLYRK